MFCWGDGSSGQLGLNFENVSVPIAGNIFSDKVTEIACGEQHTLFLTADGRILSCGRKGQLGRQRNLNSKLPAPVEGLGAVVSVSCGQDHSVAVCASGQVYSWGAGGEGQLGIALTTVSKAPRPRPVPIPSPLPITVIQVACGNYHSLALTKGGQVFSWGLNSHGQLGLGKEVPLQPIPALVRPLTGVPVTQVAAGGTHTLALTLPGLVYSCGANRAGQLGLNRVDEKGRFNICSVPALRVLGVSFISCGEAHSAVLTKDCHEDIEYGWFCDDTLKVDRETLLDDTFQQLRKMICHMVALKVKFQAEDGVDEGGVSLEFFSLLGRELLTMEPKTLEVYESGLAWLTTDDGGITDEFYLLGLLCGKALYNQCVLNLCFPLALFKKLLGLTTTLDDLKELSPTEASALQYVLDEDEEVVEALDLVFMDKGQELIPNGEELPVTMINRKKYVDLYVDMKLNKSVQSQFADFEKGFHKGCPTQTWRMFLPEELMTLLQGDDNYEWDKLRENAKYQGYRPTDDIIQNFWRVFTEFSEEEKKKFLTFLTGTDRLPRGQSLSKLQMQITSLGSTDADEYYPKAQTCSVTLCLPNYSSIDTLQEKLLHAITHCDVFGDA